MSSGGLFVGLIVGEILAAGQEVKGGNTPGLVGGALVAVSNTIILHLKRRLGLFTSVRALGHLVATAERVLRWCGTKRRTSPRATAWAVSAFSGCRRIQDGREASSYL